MKNPTCGSHYCSIFENWFFKSAKAKLYICRSF
ncbi:membrane cofactor protein, isoform CRA_b, partial [Rattus norvegicus]